MVTSIQISKAIATLRDDLIDLTRQLVRYPSITGEESSAQGFIAGYWRADGLTVEEWVPVREEIERHPAFCDDGLPVARPVVSARFGEAPPDGVHDLILNGHIDVVPAGERKRWSVDPFRAEVRDGAIFGRGSCDMKGGLAASTIAVRACRSLGVVPRRGVLLQSVTGEETGGLGTLSTILRGQRAEAVIITEPTSLALCPVQSGALSFRLRVEGRPTHGATREAGVSAVEKFWPLWEALRNLETRRHERFRHPLYEGRGLAAPLSIGRLLAGNWPSTVPEEAIAEGRYGVFPDEETTAARREFEEAIAAACRADAWLDTHPAGVEWFEGQFEPGATDPDAAILGRLAEAHRIVTGRDPARHGVPYGSDLRLFTRYGKMPAILYGPGDVRFAHAADERVPIVELETAARVLATLIVRMTQEE
ncbi:MAG: ArgE/DapE family deacylase [Acidobacteria bacterium]|nr:ArgE/DapE family deacylase [Acidobacteriota bacterium]